MGQWEDMIPTQDTYEARIQLTGLNTAVVRGYWKFKWLGRSMVFNRK
jgi:hypothetical protein